MKLITYNNETHTLNEWIEILKLLEENYVDDDLIDFAKELSFEGKITNKNLYKAYTLWSGGNTMPPTVFTKRIVKAFKSCRNDLQRFKTNNTRGWEKVAHNSKSGTKI